MLDIKPIEPSPLRILSVTINHEAHFAFKSSSEPEEEYRVSMNVVGSASQSSSSSSKKAAAATDGTFTCTCPSFLNGPSVHCKHILFLLYRHFNIEIGDCWRSRTSQEMRNFIADVARDENKKQDGTA